MLRRLHSQIASPALLFGMAAVIVCSLPGSAGSRDMFTAFETTRETLGVSPTEPVTFLMAVDGWPAASVRTDDPAKTCRSFPGSKIGCFIAVPGMTPCSDDVHLQAFNSAGRMIAWGDVNLRASAGSLRINARWHHLSGGETPPQRLSATLPRPSPTMPAPTPLFKVYTVADLQNTNTPVLTADQLATLSKYAANTYARAHVRFGFIQSFARCSTTSTERFVVWSEDDGPSGQGGPYRVLNGSCNEVIDPSNNGRTFGLGMCDEQGRFR